MDKKSDIRKFDLTAIQSSDNLDLLDDDFLIFETNTKTDFQHLVDFPTRPNAIIISLCLEGKCRMGINLKEYVIENNTITVIAPDMIVQNFGMDYDYRSFVIAMSSSFYESVFSRQNDVIPLLLYFNKYPIFALKEKETLQLLEYFRFIQRKIKEVSNDYRREIVQGLFTSFLFEFYNIYTRRTPTEIKPKTRKEEIFTHFLQALSENYKNERTVAVYAEMLYLTPKHLSGVIKEVSGKTPGEWIDERVILEAKALLKSSEMNIQQIAEALHFTNQSFFGKYFRHHVGMSPKEYRRN
jgi:AraC family transcriptional activator of pobA